MKLCIFWLIFSLFFEKGEAYVISPSRHSLFPIRRPASFLTRCYGETNNQEQQQQEQQQQQQPSEPQQVEKSSSNDILNSPAFLKRKLEVLKSDITKVDQEMDIVRAQIEQGKIEWESQLEDLQKEYRNIQDRMNSQSKQGDAMAIVQVAREILKVVDNYNRAFGSVKPHTPEEMAIEAAYQQTLEQIMETFAKLGIEPVPTVGVEFDYAVHQAVLQKPSDYEEGIVCEEFQKGFKLGDQLIRAAMVAVAA